MSEITKKEKGHFRRNWIFYSIFFVLIILSGYLWLSKSSALKKQERAFETEKTMILEQANESYQINSQKHLELMMKTFVWAVRGELTRGNLEQADQYFKQLVKADKVDEITLIDKNSKILLTTNKKNEGNMLKTDYSDAALKIEEMTIFNNGNKLVVAAPIMSLDSKLGTLIVVYKTDVFQMEKSVGLTYQQ